MDRSLDEIIAERPNPSARGRGRTAGRSRRNNFRGDFKKSYREEPADLDLDWVHDKFEDDRDSRPSQRLPRKSRTDRYTSDESSGAKIRINNLHYDLTERDLEGLFSQIGPVLSVSLVYDRAGRSEGVAFVTYKRVVDANSAIREFDGANAKGQPIRLSLVQSNTGRAGRNPFDFAERPKGSLFERAERPRDSRSLSPGGGGGGGSESDSGRRARRSDVTKPPPEHIDRYVPGQRSPARKNEGRRDRSRRAGRPRDDNSRGGGGGGGGRSTAGGRSRKTQEELDQEMEDYWGQKKTAEAEAAPNGAAAAVPDQVAQEAAMNTADAPVIGGDDDIDMIE